MQSTHDHGGLNSAAKDHSEHPTIQTNLPSRLDRLPWVRWHWLVVIALGITWILDGLEVTIVGSIGSALTHKDALGLTESQIGRSATFYLAGAIIGALLFGWLTDRYGRKKLFLITLGVYLLGTALSAFAWDMASFALFRFITGAGIGGEYAAINSAIDELLPARVRGRAALAINGSYWIGAALGAFASVMLLDPDTFDADIGWRVAFGSGAILGLAILLVRRYVPESPRWLMTHGRIKEAEAIVETVEAQAVQATGRELPPADKYITLKLHQRVGFGTIARILFQKYRVRSILGLSLMISQAFFYNAIFFTYGLILNKFYGIPADQVGWYILPFAAGNFLGPIFLGPLFDSVGRKPMIALTYTVSAVLLVLTGWWFKEGYLDATTQTFLWSVIFFVASAAASSAYLTVSEIFPLEMRGLAIALFFAVGTGAGGLFAPELFGRLIESGSKVSIFYGYLLGSSLMLIAAMTEVFIGVKAERKSLEDVAEPLTQHPSEVTTRVD